MFKIYYILRRKANCFKICLILAAGIFYKCKMGEHIKKTAGIPNCDKSGFRPLGHVFVCGNCNIPYRNIMIPDIGVSNAALGQFGRHFCLEFVCLLAGYFGEVGGVVGVNDTA